MPSQIKEPLLPRFEGLSQEDPVTNVVPDYASLSYGNSPRNSPGGLFSDYLNPDSPKRLSASSSRRTSPLKFQIQFSEESLVNATSSPIVTPQDNPESAVTSEEVGGVLVEESVPATTGTELDNPLLDETVDPSLAIQYSDLRSLLEETAEIASRRVLENFMATHSTGLSETEEAPGTSSVPSTSFGRKRQAPVTNLDVGTKRPANRYVLQDWMFRRYPVMQFFVTGPDDCERTPHKWTCRVCNQELSLMTKGAVEIMTHYRSESHLVREHRIRLETPGLPLFDKHERELLGSELQQAIEVARRTHPIAPILCAKKLYPGQTRLPPLDDEETPVALASHHITLLSRGLTYGGSFNLLSSLWRDLVQESNSPSLSASRNLSPERAMVRIFY